MSSEAENKYWVILYKITNKENWYEKVFEDKLVEKWHRESQLKGYNSDDFWLSINLLRATAQGVYHNKKCTWDEDETLCKKCFANLRKELEDMGQIEYISDHEELEEIDILDMVNEYIHEEDIPRCPHLECGCKSLDSDLDKYIKYFQKEFLHKIVVLSLKNMVTIMRKEDPIDWHPWSKEQVRDIIHPSLYCYVKGVSVDTEGKVDKTVSTESNKYQWLPSDINIDESGDVMFSSYINNLKRKEYIFLFENILTTFIPHFESVIGKSLKSKKCQVIVKVGSIHLNKDKPKYDGGAWHIEGMPYEHIIATGLYYLEVKNITPSFLEFRKPTIINEENVDYPQSDYRYTETHYGVNDHHNGKTNRYLGLIKASEGSAVIFPNTLQHRVKEFELENKDLDGVRTILAFFLIDPDHKILSTSNIPEQYNAMTLEEAKEYREKLMFQRKYFVDELNKEVYERDFSLCEH